jgi:hypothetical protein
MTSYFETLEESPVVLRGELQGDGVLLPLNRAEYKNVPFIVFVTGLTLATKCNYIKVA